MAGHRVEVAPAGTLADFLGRSHYDIILAERTEALTVPDTASADRAKASVVGVLEDPSSVELAAARQLFDGVLKAPQPLSEILKMLDDVMSARVQKSRA
jgi:hypothetical protein